MQNATFPARERNDKKHEKETAYVLMYFTLIVLALIFLLPILYVFYNALLPYRYVQTWAPVSVWTLDNFKELFTQYPILRWYWNTFLSTVIVVLGNLLFRPWQAMHWQNSISPGKSYFRVPAALYDGTFSAYYDPDVHSARETEHA